MAAMLKNAAAGVVNKGPPATFYNNASKQNPVLQKLEQEINLYVAYMKKRVATGYKKPSEEAYSRPADTLFELWNKYESRLPQIYYQKKLLQMGDFLVSIKEYNLALWQCYGRYLKHFGDINVEEIKEVDTFKKFFFPQGFKTEDAGFTFRALMGKAICTYQVVCLTDAKLQNVESVTKCIQLLNFLRLITQVILPKESLCWLVYNGTVHIYSISRHLMSLGHSAKVLEFTLWACMCMESSVPLLSSRHLTWRATLYTAVCQCYYDCKAGHHAESFARRALTKINELSQLEDMSETADTKDTEDIFRQATVKMAIMVYRRTVFETRRKPKGLLRPKTRANLKDAAQVKDKVGKVKAKALPWPRTQSERLLVEMFEGSAAQMLCLLETVQDSNRRTLLSSPPAADSEVEILDVYAELFMAAQEIVAGGGGNHGNTPHTADIKVPGMAGIVKDKSMIEMATRGEDGIPLHAVVRMVKYAYCYEQWDVYDSMIDSTISAIKEVNDPRYGPDEKALELLKAYDKVTPRTRHRRLFANDDDSEANNDPGLPLPPHQGRSGGGAGVHDDLINLAEVLLSIISGPYSQLEVDVDMVVDACLSLWNKCKAVFQKYQTGSTDNPKYLYRMENPSKWVYILDIVHQVLGWCGLNSVDPALTSEVALRLALVFEASAALEASSGKSVKGTKLVDQDDDQSLGSASLKDGGSLRRGSDGLGSEYDVGVQMSRLSVLSGAPWSGQGQREQLLQAREILELGLDNVSHARQAVALTDGKSIADIGWVKELNVDLFKPLTEEELAAQTAATVTPGEEEDGKPEVVPPVVEGDAHAVWNMIKDLHLELIFIYHRICLKLAQLGPDPRTKAPKPFRRRTCSNLRYGSSGELADAYIETSEELTDNCKKSSLSRALLCMQKALMADKGTSPNKEQKNLLEEARTHILKAQVEEKRLYTDNTPDGSTKMVTVSKVAPPPILLCRTDTTMVFRPSPFKPSGTDKVAWYRIFGRTASGSNVKVRLNDYFLPGCGEEVPSFRCELRVSGLTPGEKYVFAVAAYTAEGKLIGESIGETTKPVLATHPLPVLLTWAYLCQVGYQIGETAIVREACSVLWSHFVAEPPPPQQVTYITSAQKDVTLILHRLNRRVVSLASPVLLRMFLTSIFIHVDINVRDGALFCDKLCDQGPLNRGQLDRLHQCEKMLVGLELAGWLNEANAALQAVIQCYGLLAPMIYFKIPAVPVIQVLERCHAILQEIPSHLRVRRQMAIAESLHHMTACLTYHLAKVLRTWNQRPLASNINDSGRKMLAVEPEKEAVPARVEQIRAVDKDKKDIPGVSSSVMGAAGRASAQPPGGATSQALPATEEEDPTAGADRQTETGSLTLAALKKKKTRKGMMMSGREDSDATGNEELKALEAHMLRLSKQAQGEHELSGNEDPSILHAYVAYLPSKMAYKEVAKFKRRARYLEFFVQVAQKALAEGLPEQALEWCDDTVQWLIKGRNEQILGTKAIVSKQPGAMTVIGDDPKKFAAAMVEYSRDGGHKDASPRGKDGKNKGAQKQGKQKKPKYKAIGITPNMSEAQKQAQEEAELKALQMLSMHLVDMIQNNNRRKRFRKICIDEIPWRVQLNIIQGLSQFGVFLQKLEFREKMFGNLSNHMYKTAFLDQEWFTFETAGTLVVGWEGGPSRQVTRQDHRKSVQYSQQGRASGIEMAAAAATGKPPGSLFPIPQEEADTPRTYRSETHNRGRIGRSDRRTAHKQEEEVESVVLTVQESRDMLQKTFAHFLRAINLAHRGQHWTLMQNACRALWNCTHTALLRTYSSSHNSLLTVESLRALAWEPFYNTADCLLDMVIQLEKEQDKVKKRKMRSHGEDELNMSWMGGVKDERGGASLKFENPLDDISFVDMRWMKRIVLRVLEMLYYEQKWEKLAHIALRFNAISNNRYAEQVNPLLVQAQRKLVNRVSQYNGPSVPQPQFQLAEHETGGPITAERYSKLQLRVVIHDEDQLSQIHPGAHIDPEGHELYSGGIHAMRLCCVPLDVSQTLTELRQSLDGSQYTARALQHSRRLLVLYLSGQMNVHGAVATHGESRVDFIPTTARPQPTMPPDLSKEEFLTMDDVQTSPLPRSQLGIVMASYEKTIEMLLANKQRGLAAEAMKELGNLHYHTASIRGAYHWWCESLDMLLNTKDAIHEWRHLLLKTKDKSALLLNKCGLWGCLLGGVLASNIAQYILTTDLGLRIECCFLSGYFFKALFRSSLPHPTADRDYAIYDVGEGCEVTYLIPGIDLMSERYRTDGRTLVSALRFIMDELSRGRHNLFVLPLLTLYLYFTTFVCRDLQRSVDGRILRVRVLTDLHLFTETFIVLQRLLHGERLPHTADSHFRQLESRVQAAKFDCSKPLLEPSNLKVLELVIDKRLSSNLGMMYGPHLTCQLSVAQAHVYTTLASTLPVLPKFEDIGAPGSNVYMHPHTISTFSRVGGNGPHLGSSSRLSQTTRLKDDKIKGNKRKVRSNSMSPSPTRKESPIPMRKESPIPMRKESPSPKHKRSKSLSHGSVKKTEKPQTSLSPKKQPEQDGKHSPRKKFLPTERLKSCKRKRFTSLVAGWTILLYDDDDESVAGTQRQGKRFSSRKKPVSTEIVKGVLLSTSDQILSTLSEIIMDNAIHEKGMEAMTPAELEVVIQSKLELADIAQQRHHAALASRTILTAMKMLQTSNIFKDNKNEATDAGNSAMRGETRGKRDSPIRITEPESSQFQYQNFQSRSRLDARLWLRCRLALVKSMMDEIHGMGQVKGPEKMVKPELADVRLYCAEGVAEAEACGDLEMHAEFLMQGVILDILEGHPIDNTKLLLQDILCMLEGVSQLSTPGQMLQTLAMIHMTDLTAVAPPEKATEMTVDTTLPEYCKAQTTLLRQLEDMGEKVEHHFPVGGRPELSTPCCPLQNVYLPHLLLLVQVKLRIGHALARKVTKTLHTSKVVEDIAASWTEPLGVLTTALEICQVIMTRIASIEAELLLNIGKVQRQLFRYGHYQVKAVAHTLVEAIKTSYAADHDLGLIRQAYLELAILYLSAAGPPQLSLPKEGSVITDQSLPDNEDAQEDDTMSRDSARSRRKKREEIEEKRNVNEEQSVEDSTQDKAKKERSQSLITQEPDDEEKRTAWLAIRCATAAGHAQRACLLLTGNTAVTTQTINQKSQADLPEFAVLDLVSAYVLGEKKKIYKNEIEEELAPLTEALEPPALETYEDQITKCRAATQGLSWVQILGYQSILQRLCSTSTLTTVKQREDAQTQDTEADLGSEFDLGFISHAQFDISLNHDMVRSVLFSPAWMLRQNYMHQFLVAHLPAYSNDCVAIYPPAALQVQPPEGPHTDLPVIHKPYTGNKYVPADAPANAQPGDGVLPPGQPVTLHKPDDKRILTPKESEICLQWYQPSLEEGDPNNVSTPLTRQILLLYAVSKKKSDRTTTAHLWVTMRSLLDLHDRLAVLTQRGEISLADPKPKKEKESAPTPSKGKKQTRIKALSPKVKRDEQLEALLLQCMADVKKLLGIVEQPAPTPVPTTVEEAPLGAPPSEDQAPPEPNIPFEVSKANMHNLERLFDPSFGFCLKDAKMHAWLNTIFQ